MADAPIPSVVAMLVCDQVITEWGTGKKSLIGIFESVIVPAFPAAIKIGIYAKLVDAEGNYGVLIRLVNLKDESKVAEMQAEAKGVKREAAWELALNINGIILPEAGKYEFQLFANDAFLHRVTLNALGMPAGGFKWQPPK